ncbi:hypothetical protein BDA99DRAFT_541447 [Phascolomyces articulosus]|uniref:Restriction of telomere capping protein 4 n=1 Tax=Phascolomyces articulosus TaxID=60185 RepID=A0AAD5JS96_9FUNG|nr:hypothetical protein BDA99DRAFT_541447 [Phascolomyces articulosus]
MTCLKGWHMVLYLGFELVLSATRNIGLMQLKMLKLQQTLSVYLSLFILMVVFMNQYFIFRMTSLMDSPYQKLCILLMTKRFPRMTWPPILPQSMTIWKSRGRDQSEYKAAWKYIHRKKYPKITSTNGSSKQPIVIEDDDDKASSKDKVLEELREKLKAIEAIPVERVINPCLFCRTSLGDPMPEAIKKVYDEYVQKNEQYRKDREKEAVDKDTRFIQIRTITRDLQLTFQEQMNFCQVHKIELIYKPEAIEQGYPQDINFKALPERILPHLETLVEIAKGKLYSPFRDNEEAFFKEIKDSGYYGIRGRDVMLRVLQRDLLFTKKITSKDTKPLDEITFIQTILVPECSILLI